MRKYILHILIISFVFLLTPTVHSAEEQYITIRSSYTDISMTGLRTLPNISMRTRERNGISGYSTITHSYEMKSIDGDGVVIDHFTGLMWHQSGSRKYMKYKRSMKWLEDLNKKGHGGYNDWRLPTVEEAASLLESSKREGMYIDPIFSNKQKWIMTGDTNGLECEWIVNYLLGSISWEYCISDVNYVRPVRSMK